jgi:photosystem II stability/assembly factor-like uncharacterized protein
MDARLGAVVIAFAVMVGACGTPPEAATSTPKPKPSAAPTVTPTPPPSIQPFEDVWFVNPNDGWAVILSGADHAIEAIHSRDGGATWSQPLKVTTLPDGDAAPRAGIRFVNPQVGWIFGRGVFTTADGGQT